jgi:hypothetical protein
MARIGYFINDDGDKIDVYTVPTGKRRSWWWKRNSGWVDSPHFVLVRNKYGWAYVLPSNDERIVYQDGYKQIVEAYWREKDES